MARLQELKQRLQDVEQQIKANLRAIDAVPDSLPYSVFCRRLNALEARGIALEEEQKRLQREIELYEDILAEVRNG